VRVVEVVNQQQSQEGQKTTSKCANHFSEPNPFVHQTRRTPNVRLHVIDSPPVHVQSFLSTTPLSRRGMHILLATWLAVCLSWTLPIHAFPATKKATLREEVRAVS
jgi:hypothetical protein